MVDRKSPQKILQPDRDPWNCFTKPGLFFSENCVQGFASARMTKSGFHVAANRD